MSSDLEVSSPVLIKRLENERNLKELTFNSKIGVLSDLLNDISISHKDVMKEAYNDVKTHLAQVVQAHEAYISAMDSDTTSAHINWVIKAQDVFRTVNLQYSKRMSESENMNSSKNITKNSLRL